MNGSSNFMIEEVNRFFIKLPHLVANTLWMIIAVIAGLIIQEIIKLLFNFYYKHSSFFLMRSVVTHLYKPAGFFIPLLILNMVLPFMQMGAKLHSGINKTVEIALTISFAAMLISSIKIAEDFVTHRYDLNKSDNLRERKIRTQLQFLRKFVMMLIILLTIAAVLLSFDNLRKIGAGLLTGVGIGGIIIGFAAQKSLGNLLAGFQIAFTQPIRLDDVLVVENEWGRVEEITLTYVVLRIWDQRRLILPINYFIEKPFQNWTRISADLLGAVFLYLDYSVPVDKLREEFNRLLSLTPLWDKKASALQVTDARERTVEVRFLMSAKNSGTAFDLRCYIRENMIAFIQKNYPGCLPKTRAEFNSNLHDGQLFPQTFSTSADKK